MFATTNIYTFVYLTKIILYTFKIANQYSDINYIQSRFIFHLQFLRIFFMGVCPVKVR